MKHLGDITKINGAEASPVNVIIGGSPCQDLSVAGKRAGLAGERSGLFMEQLRIIKEMRKADADRGRTGKDIRPRFMVWENVPGAFSSNKGADFGAVLQETIRVICEEVPVVPMPNKGWPLAGCLYGEGGGIGPSHGEYLTLSFGEYPSVGAESHLSQILEDSPHPKYSLSAKACQGIIRRAERRGKPLPDLLRTVLEKQAQGGGLSQPTYCIQGNCIDRADTAGCNGKGWTEDVSYTLNTVDRPAVCGFKSNMGAKAHGIGFEEGKAPTLSAGQHDASVCIAIENHPNDSRVKLSENNVVQSLTGRMGTGGGNTPMILKINR